MTLSVYCIFSRDG